MELETFETRTRLACCGTCREWGIRYTDERRREILTWCPALQIELPDDLQACGCAAWVREPRETFAVKLYQELTEAGAP